MLTKLLVGSQIDRGEIFLDSEDNFLNNLGQPFGQRFESRTIAPTKKSSKSVKSLESLPEFFYSRCNACLASFCL